MEHKDLEPGPVRVVAIDTGSGLIYVNPEGRGVVAGVVFSTLDGGNVTVKDDESVRIYQSTGQFQITGDGFNDNTKASGAVVNVSTQVSIPTVVDANPASRASELD